MNLIPRRPRRPDRTKIVNPNTPCPECGAKQTRIPARTITVTIGRNEYGMSWPCGLCKRPCGFTFYEMTPEVRSMLASAADAHVRTVIVDGEVSDRARRNVGRVNLKREVNADIDALPTTAAVSPEWMRLVANYS